MKTLWNAELKIVEIDEDEAYRVRIIPNFDVEKLKFVLKYFKANGLDSQSLLYSLVGTLEDLKLNLLALLEEVE